MQKLISAGIAGMVFGTGIAISGMANPAKVMNFFDIFGTFDPSLIFVMGGGLIVAMAGYQFIFRTREKPLFDEKFSVPTSKLIDTQLIGGSALFGIGWGITGFCPGGAIPVVGLGIFANWEFMVAMIVGMMIAMAIKVRMGKPKFGLPDAAAVSLRR